MKLPKQDAEESAAATHVTSRAAGKRPGEDHEGKGPPKFSRRSLKEAMLAKAMHDSNAAKRRRMESASKEFKKNQDAEVCKGMIGELGGDRTQAPRSREANFRTQAIGPSKDRQVREAIGRLLKY